MSGWETKYAVTKLSDAITIHYFVRSGMAARSNVAFPTEKSVTRLSFVESTSFGKINNKREKRRTEEMRVIVEIK
jgi:hypothetical protein